MTETETWRPVVGYEGLYEVSDRGSVRSHSSWKRGELLKPKSNRRGYQRVSLWRDGQRRYRKVHHLVLHAFVGPRPEGHQAAHWNGCKTDNRLNNLRWASAADNVADTIRLGRHVSARKVACLRGHAYSPDNTYTDSRGWRQCRECQRDRARARDRRRRAQAEVAA
ncbi:HNH endonuclease [Haloactinospora alba]|uniref:HNH endonuclease n=1 Tax=Haloactinospora alba TaxID=405555 RepID=A0A543NG21_9ACTN|nr:NUMOD4 motif-containing HNH endonuclease [Haloactinospora alba]TQN30744.1 HNH endonuclease [Haloactinospora alba]